MQDIRANFEFRNRIPRLSKADALGMLIEKLTPADINLNPEPVKDTDGTVRNRGFDNHGMGTVFEELIRRFNEENSQEASEYFGDGHRPARRTRSGSSSPSRRAV